MGVDRSNKWVDRFTVTGLRWTSSLFPTITIGFYSHSNENVVASLLDDEGNPLRFHALPGRRVVEGVNDDDYIGLHINN